MIVVDMGEPPEGTSREKWARQTVIVVRAVRDREEVEVPVEGRMTYDGLTIPVWIDDSIQRVVTRLWVFERNRSGENPACSRREPHGPHKVRITDTDPVSVHEYWLDCLGVRVHPITMIGGGRATKRDNRWAETSRAIAEAAQAAKSDPGIIVGAGLRHTGKDSHA